ncbi:MAG: hypothetical protein JO181_04230 [Solirubrobacterales bacterium]|nr:hypothetical protein [Solirubrobacterales bacterium]MBV9003843.1 hypothetical protein [Solirubrobacterales bacterium]
MNEREGLIARIRQVQRSAATGWRRSSSTVQANDDMMRALEERVAHLERLVEGLQDSVHREALRQGKRIAELETRIQPAELSKALSKDARDRGL